MEANQLKKRIDDLQRSITADKRMADNELAKNGETNSYRAIVARINQNTRERDNAIQVLYSRFNISYNPY